MIKIVIFNIFFIFALALIFFIPSISYAISSVEILEILPNPDGSDANGEYIKIKNNGSTKIRLDKLKVRTNRNTNGTKHRVNPINENEDAENIFLDISDEVFLINNKNFFISGNRFYSPFSLKNENDGVSLFVCDVVVDLLEYTGNAESGVTIPGGDGSIRSASAGDCDNLFSVETTKEIESSKSEKTTSKNNNKTSENLKQTGIFINSDVIYEKLEYEFFAGTRTDRRDTKLNGFWNFGNGVKTQNGREVVYKFPNTGEYIITFDYSSRGREKVFYKRKIEVLPLDIFLERKDDTSVFLINNLNQDLNVSNWKLVDGNNIFTFPKNTFISKNSKITIALKEDTDTLSIKTDKDIVVFENKVKTVKTNTNNTQTVKQKTVITNKPVLETKENETDLSNKKNTSVFVWLFVLILIICLSIVPLFFIKKK